MENALQTYFDSMRDHRVLSRDEEASLSRDIWAGKKALDELEAKVEANEDFSDALDVVYDTAVEAIEAFKMREDEILELSADL